MVQRPCSDACGRAEGSDIRRNYLLGWVGSTSMPSGCSVNEPFTLPTLAKQCKIGQI